MVGETSTALRCPAGPRCTHANQFPQPKAEAPPMNRTCNHCASERVVPVLDKRIESRGRAGNKFRTRCLHCGHWNPMCSRADFLMSVANDEKDAYVLPADADPDEVDSIVLVEEFEGEIKDLRQGITKGSLPEPEPEQESETEETKNRFHCPVDGCGAEHTGFPDQCERCGTAYTWPAEEVA